MPRLGTALVAGSSISRVLATSLRRVPIATSTAAATSGSSLSKKCVHDPEERDIFDGAADRADVIARRDDRNDAAGADAAIGGLHGDDAAARRRDADRATGVGAD